MYICANNHNNISVYTLSKIKYGIQYDSQVDAKDEQYPGSIRPGRRLYGV